MEIIWRITWFEISIQKKIWIFSRNDVITVEENEDKYPKWVVSQECISLWEYNNENLFNVDVIETHFFSIWNPSVKSKCYIPTRVHRSHNIYNKFTLVFSWNWRTLRILFLFPRISNPINLMSAVKRGHRQFSS